MKRIFSWLIKAWSLSLLGVILLSLIVWFEGPLLAFDGREPFASQSVRWTWIGVFFLLWAAYFLWKFIAAKIANARLISSVAGEAPAGAQAPTPGARESAAEMNTLNKRMQEAVAILRKTRLGQHKGGLYQLPWYMFVGAPGTGKTTALVHSGLKFPLADAMGQGAVGGVGGTRNCDWWFTDEAVLLDTAGRYATQDSHAEVDKAGWENFLKLLRKHRARRPVNGVILALSVADLIEQSEASRQAQAQAIRERIHELHEKLGLRFPIYVMVTKCDLLAGFMEFFSHLGREERAQVWGMTFPLADGNGVDAALAAFPQEFQLLEQQLQARVLARMQQERDTQKRALIYSFPQQFAAIGDVLGRFLNDVFQSSRYQEKSLLRGVYFTSGTQEGRPIDRVMSAMAASFGLDRQVLPANAASGRSYFITSVMQKVIFPEAELAGLNLGLERKRRALQWGALTGISLLFVLIGAAMITSYVRNQSQVADMDRRATEVAKMAAALPAQASVTQALPLLDAARSLTQGYSGPDESIPWLMRWGLYQGDKLEEGAQQGYRKLLRAILLPRVQQRLEDELRRSQANQEDYLYEVLRVYLMLGDATHFDAESVAAWLAYDYERNLADATSEQKQALKAHVLALLAQYRQVGSMAALNAQLISDVRLALANMPLEQRIYKRLKRELERSQLPEFTLASAGGRDASVVLVRRSGLPLTRGINGLFSVAGYDKFLAQNDQALADVEKDSWILGPQQASAAAGNRDQMKAAVLQLFHNDYIAQWDALLGDVDVAAFTNLDQGARITTILSGAESPLRKLLSAASKETTLAGSSADKPLDSMSEAVKGKLDAYKKKLESAIGATTPQVPAPAPSLHPVDAHFEDLHKMTAGSPAPLDQTLAMLKDVAAFLDAAAAAKRTGAPAPAGDALLKVKREADGKPAPLAALLQGVSAKSASLTSGSEKERLNSLWTSRAAPFCRQAVAGRYPIVRSAAQDVAAEDFGKFFAPGGLMDDFFQKNLLQYVDMGGAQWRWRSTADNASLGISQEVLNEFQRASRIRDAFFSNGGLQVSMRFDLKPTAIDSAISTLALDIDGQVLNLTPGATAGASFQLPSGKGTGQVHLEVTPASARSSLRTSGPWAWFHMLDKASVEPTAQGERYKVSFDLDGRKAVFELTASSVLNPFKRQVLEGFRCMDKL